MDEPSTITLVQRWEAATARVKELKSSLNGAEVAERNATNELGKWLTPKDAKPGEQFCYWHVHNLLTVSMLSTGNYHVVTRPRSRNT